MEHISDNQKDLHLSILEYAWVEFKRMGLKKVKMDDISSHFSISKRTLYEMFEDKETLVVECFKHQLEKSRLEIEKIQKEAKHSLETYVMMFVERIKELEAVNPIFFSEAFKYPRLIQYFDETTEQRNNIAMDIIRQCVNDGYFIPDFNYQMLLDAYNLQLLNIIRMELFKKYKMNDMLNTLQIISFRGCCTKKGLELFDAQLDKLKIF